ncbi:MAG: hypothetical protein COB69_04880 [Phycisphaera sp.]|nr:MAG: hypothetical protein COB69_04880 [Phycisphaera sp.]
MTHERTIVGVMTGTSIDAIDIAVVKIAGKGLGISAVPTAFQSFPLGDLADSLRLLANNTATAPSSIATIENDFGKLIAESIAACIGSEKIDLAVIHGQTIFHNPPLTWQLLNPWPIVSKLGVPVVYDLRRADLALGGQGAPLTPIADAVLFGHPTKRRAIINLGGFCNATLLPALPESEIETDFIRGYDLCPCNHWLDGIMRTRTHSSFDDNGERASTGSPIESLVQSLMDQCPNTGVGHRSLGSSDDRLFDLGEHSTADLLATCCDVIARLIAEAATDCDELLCAGGSVRNEHLMSRIRVHSPIPVVDLADAGVEPEAREAVAFAVLGALCMDAVPIGLAGVTGVCKPIVSGSWCFPSGPDTLSHA